MSPDSPSNPKNPENEFYEPPEIIYESVISTRAGSPIIGGDTLQPPEEQNAIELFPSD